MMRELKRVDTPVAVILNPRVINGCSRMMYFDPVHETGGLLIGSISRDTVNGDYTVRVEDLYWEEKQTGSPSHFAFSPDYQLRAMRYAEKRGWRIIGNAHSHAGYPAFFSGTDEEMMAQNKEACFYLVVTPSHGGQHACWFKDGELQLHPCELRIAAENQTDTLFDCSVEKLPGQPVILPGGRSAKTVCYRSLHHYDSVIQGELDKRFLHSREQLANKRVCVVGCGTLGNLLVESLIHSGVGHLTLLDMDSYETYNLPRSPMVDRWAVGQPKALALAKAAAERCSFDLTVNGIVASAYDLGMPFFSQFDLVLSPLDNLPARIYVDRACKLFGVTHITLGTSVLNDRDFTGNVLVLPGNVSVDLPAIWGNGYVEKMRERMSCGDHPKDVQAQVLAFSSQIAGIAADLAMKWLCENLADTNAAYKYTFNALSNGIATDKMALQVHKYTHTPAPSVLFDVFQPGKAISHIVFDSTRPKSSLWEKLRACFGETGDYCLDLEWSFVPLAFMPSGGAMSCLFLTPTSGLDDTFAALPRRQVYLLRGEENDYLVDLELATEEETR